MNAVLWLLVLLPAFAGGALVVTRAERWAVPTALVVCAGTVALALVAAVGRPEVAAAFLPGQPFTLRVDGLAGLVAVVVAVVATGVLVAAVPEIESARARFYGVMLVFLSAVLVTVTASSLLSLLMAWEVMGATSYALIAFDWRAGEKVRSGATALLTTRAADLGLYAAAGAAVAGGGSLAFDRLPQQSGWPLHVVTAGVVLAALGKAAQLPLSFWLARAMEGPSPVSALLHSAAMVAMGGYLLLRLQPLLVAASWAGPTVAWVGVSTAVLLGAVALVQSDLKLLLAASTASQLGFVVLAAGVGTVSGGALHLVGHAFVKSTLFLAAGGWLAVTGTRDLRRLGGVARRHPRVGAAFVVAALALAGLPPLTLWSTKDGVLAVAYADSPALYAAGLLAAALAAGYSGRAIALVLRPQPRPADKAVPRLAWWPLLPLAAVAAAGGAVALPQLREAVDRLLGVPGGPVPHLAELAGSAVVAVTASALAWRSARPAPAAPAVLRNWLHLEAAAQALVVRPVLALSRGLAAFDDEVLDRGVMASGAAVRRAAGLSRLADDGGVDRLVQGVASGVRTLGRQARRPQTGQLHHYLAQATAVLVAAALVLLVGR